MYFDYTATTPIDNEILDLYVNIQKKYYANTSSLHLLGQKANNIYEQMKMEIKNVLSVNHEVVFTSNATEANNLGILGIVEDKKGKVITTEIEHPSVYNVFKELENRGYDVVYLKVDKEGIIDLEQLKQEMNNDVLLVSIMWVNNIIGSIQPIKEIIEIVKKYPKAKLHVDAVQGITKIKANFNFDDIELLTMSAHKFYGPKGIGVLLYKQNINLNKRLFGSNAQKGVKPGTLDLGLIACCAKALKKYSLSLDQHYQYVKELNQYLRENINNSKIIINSSDKCSPYILNLSVMGINGETLVHKLESYEIYVSTGSSCSSKLAKPEKTVYAISKDENRAKSVIRISLSFLTTKEEIKLLLEVLNKL